MKIHIHGGGCLETSVYGSGKVMNIRAVIDDSAWGYSWRRWIIVGALGEC